MEREESEDILVKSQPMFAFQVLLYFDSERISSQKLFFSSALNVSDTNSTFAEDNAWPMGRKVNFLSAFQPCAARNRGNRNSLVGLQEARCVACQLFRQLLWLSH